MSDVSVQLCPQCFNDLRALFGLEASQKLTFCPQCQFPLALLAGKYRLEKQIGEGGFGKVYLARHVNLQRDQERVVKIINPEIFKLPGMEARFFREVQVTSSVARNNDHIVRIYDDFGKHPQIGHFYIMEYLEGQPLSTLLEPPGHPLPLPLAMHIFSQLCEAIDAAHQEGVIHRDLKPDNIFLIQRKHDDAFVKVLDFGIAKPTDIAGLEQTNLTQGALGTPLYMAPEQWTNQPIDTRIDIYAMGLILYQMLTGHLPFATKQSNMSMQDLIAAHLYQPPAPFAQVAPQLDLTPTLESTIFKALEKNPNDRYPNANAFWHALEVSQPLDHTQVLPSIASITAERKIAAPQLHTRDYQLSTGQGSGAQATATPPPAAILPSADSLVNALPRTPASLSTPRPTPNHQPTNAPKAIWVALGLSVALALGALSWWFLQKNNDTPNQTTRKPDNQKTSQPENQKTSQPENQPTRKPDNAPCPQGSTNERWLFLRLASLSNLQVRAADGFPPLKRHTKVKEGLCLGLSKATSIVLTKKGYFPCHFPVAFRNATLQVRLKKSSFDEIDPNHNYCIQR